MGLIAAKFGGSSTAGAAQFRQILALVRQDPGRRVIVLSAPGARGEGDEKTTDTLARCWRHFQSGADCEAEIRRIASRFSEIADGLGLALNKRAMAAEIRTALARSEDATLSRGEALCARLFSRFSQIPCVDAARLVAFDAAGFLDIPRTLARFAAEAKRSSRMIVPGFYGADEAGSIHTLPRNGSDVTGALAAVGIGADVYENWTDVPGVLRADPAIVPNARPIPRIGYAQMRALAAAGARVLHPDALAPVERAGIPTLLRCTARPELPGTLITADYTRIEFCVASRVDENGGACVTAFMEDATILAGIVGSLKSKRVEWKKDCVRFTVPAGERYRAVRAVHDALDR